MLEIGEAEARDRLGSLLGLVATGEEVIITQNGKAVARLISERTMANSGKARRAADDILAESEKVTLAGLSIRELIDEGRR